MKKEIPWGTMQMSAGRGLETLSPSELHSSKRECLEKRVLQELGRGGYYVIDS